MQDFVVTGDSKQNPVYAHLVGMEGVLFLVFSARECSTLVFFSPLSASFAQHLVQTGLVTVETICKQRVHADCLLYYIGVLFYVLGYSRSLTHFTFAFLLLFTKRQYMFN